MQSSVDVFVVRDGYVVCDDGALKPTNVLRGGQAGIELTHYAFRSWVSERDSKIARL